MATTSREIKNGHSVAAPTGEVEVRPAKNVPSATKIGFLVTSGSMQVTTAPKGSQDVINADIAAFGNTNYPIYMSIEPGDKSGLGGAVNVFIKGSGTIVFFF